MREASARIAAGIVLAAAGSSKENHENLIDERRSSWLKVALVLPVRRGRLWWAYDHYRTEAECLADYRACKDWSGSIEHQDSRRPEQCIKWADEYIALAKASLSTGDGFVTLTAECVRFLELEKEAA